MTASHFGFVYVDTGALYRCIGHYALSNGVSPDDAEGVKLLLPLINLEMSHDGEGTQRMILNGEDITAHIRSPETSMAASTVSAMPAVRAFLLSMQREMAERYDVVMDGRDIGTVVLPQAGLKVFLTAKPETRAHRRYLELLEKGVETTLDEVLRDLNLRDKNDSEREAAPLRPAEGAVMLDTTEMSLDESFEALCNLITARFFSEVRD
jgi:cytidylate kinase